MIYMPLALSTATLIISERHLQRSDGASWFLSSQHWPYYICCCSVPEPQQGWWCPSSCHMWWDTSLWFWRGAGCWDTTKQNLWILVNVFKNTLAHVAHWHWETSHSVDLHYAGKLWRQFLPNKASNVPSHLWTDVGHQEWHLSYSTRLKRSPF